LSHRPDISMRIPASRRMGAAVFDALVVKAIPVSRREDYPRAERWYAAGDG
jgi:hypothetical protein